jgi:hypothetical protein
LAEAGTKDWKSFKDGLYVFDFGLCYPFAFASFSSFLLSHENSLLILVAGAFQLRRVN